jgi:hypothetical protein
LEGRTIERIQRSYTLYKSTTYRCDARIVDFVLENYKRKIEDIPIIPLLFCVLNNGDNLRYNVDQICDQNRSYNTVTASEIRRCYKLYSEFKSSPDQTLSEVVREMFIFADVRKNKQPCDDDYSFRKVDTIWESQAWEAAWQQRQGSKKTPEQKEAERVAEVTQSPLFLKDDCKFDWRDELLTRIDDYRRLRIRQYCIHRRII